MIYILFALIYQRFSYCCFNAIILKSIKYIINLLERFEWGRFAVMVILTSPGSETNISLFHR